VLGLSFYGAAVAMTFATPHAPASTSHLAAEAPILQLEIVALPLPQIVPQPKPAIVLAALAQPARPVAATEMNCLAEAVYYEARGETLQGQRAVAEVVARRSKERGYPRSICGVVYQDAHLVNRCQFSFACDGIQPVRRDRKAWAEAVEVAHYELTGPGRLEDLTSGATHFHTPRVRPSWSKRFVRTVQIGNHIFYRQPGTSYAAS
jgi:spore germination cell wall hydrolase CwlJ-like protein